ncbi:MAG TPA: hypothetical protein VIV11_12135 [Kofleriaceae bacterium]
MRSTLCLFVLGFAACDVGAIEVEPDDEGDPEPAQPLALGAEARMATADEATVAQINPYYGGRFSDLDTKGPVTYRTARRMAAFIRDSWPRLSVIGMQEIDNVENAQKLAEILATTTGHPWNVQHFGRGSDNMPSTQEAIFWRSDLWTPIEVLGTRQVEALDTARGPSTLSVRFGGLLLRRNGTNRELAMFTGKLAWLGRKHNGVPIDNGDRAEEVDRLMTWIDNKLAAHPNATRVVAMDVNAEYDTAPWRHMRRQFGDGGDDRPTHWTFGANRFDGLFWDYDAGAKRSDNFGFVGGPYRSANFGSDHRAVAARIKLR